MTDVVSAATRSRMMAGIRGRDTKPELTVRKALHGAGYRFRLHRRDLPGTPDIVLPKHRVCIFVHGCFWHRHLGCRFATSPATRVEFWSTKFQSNVARDAEAQRRLIELGWRVLIVWECGIKQGAEPFMRWFGRQEFSTPSSQVLHWPPAPPT